MRLRSGHLVLALLSFACLSVTAASKPRNIILVIGDGMGPAHFTAAKLLRGKDFRIGSMPVTGLIDTSAANSIVTDSAAAATAYATGTKTGLHMLSVDLSGNRLKTALEVAESTGRATGLVTTADFYDATPAAFAVHHHDRYDREPIVRQMLKSGAEILAGGGAGRFGTKDIPAALEPLATQNGFTVISTGAQLATARGNHILVCFKTEENEVDSKEASLTTLARWALDRLARDPDGFFVLLEHEGTDGSSHSNATRDFEKSVRAVDEVVGIALDFAAKHPDTLVLVTGDHETGGLQIQREKAGAPLELVWSTTGHTGEIVPIFAKGPGAERFGGLMDNTDVGKRLKELLGR